MNYPSKASGNWTWRMAPDALTVPLRNGIKEINTLYGRIESDDVEEEETDPPSEESD
jgi:4-alpha-glucanotransferase